VLVRELVPLCKHCRVYLTPLITAMCKPFCTCIVCVCVWGGGVQRFDVVQSWGDCFCVGQMPQLELCFVSLAGRRRLFNCSSSPLGSDFLLAAVAREVRPSQ